MFIDDVIKKVYPSGISKEFKGLTEASDADEDDYLQSRGTFVVSSYGNDYMEPTGRPKTFKDPGKAIEEWFKQSKRYPTCAMIMGYIDGEKKLREWVLDNEETFREWADKYNCPYKIEYLIDACKQPVRRTNDKWPDQLYPFALG